MKGKRLISLLVLLLLWELGSRLSDMSFFPSPLVVLGQLSRPEILTGLLSHLGYSLLRVFAALIFSFIPALILGIASGTSKTFDRLISPVMYFLFPIPKIALLPLVILFLGLGNGSKIFMVGLIVFFQFYLNITDGVKEIDRHYFDSYRSLGGKFSDSLFHLIIPAVLPRIFSTVRLTLGTGIAVLFLTETYASRTGIGWYIMDAWSRLAYGEMYGGIFVLGAAGFFLMELVNLGQRLLCPWTESKT
ncbi:ABC transporter permease [Spirochaeta isovalerica]|uniref:NitT/TauT family transport system permease protein n=1 Tax=Spirochaeta isovalerica TaxID=150 RepID=A0A841RAN2_9SPIO|nr:ABC transporter permease [Spirochaeta isovalerica]MBB6480307.1 NitT/TauT family transport system permease protein [Spirochaeta isovalerica]